MLQLGMVDRYAEALRASEIALLDRDLVEHDVVRQARLADALDENVLGQGAQIDVDDVERLQEVQPDVILTTTHLFLSSSGAPALGSRSRS